MKRRFLAILICFLLGGCTKQTEVEKPVEYSPPPYVPLTVTEPQVIDTSHDWMMDQIREEGYLVKNAVWTTIYTPIGEGEEIDKSKEYSINPIGTPVGTLEAPFYIEQRIYDRDYGGIYIDDDAEMDISYFENVTQEQLDELEVESPVLWMENNSDYSDVGVLMAKDGEIFAVALETKCDPEWLYSNGVFVQTRLIRYTPYPLATYDIYTQSLEELD